MRKMVSIEKNETITGSATGVNGLFGERPIIYQDFI